MEIISRGGRAKGWPVAGIILLYVLGVSGPVRPDARAIRKGTLPLYGRFMNRPYGYFTYMQYSHMKLFS